MRHVNSPSLGSFRFWGSGNRSQVVLDVGLDQEQDIEAILFLDLKYHPVSALAGRYGSVVELENRPFHLP
jgi:hypothetical protein